MDLNTTTFTEYHTTMIKHIENNTTTKTTILKYNNKIPYINNEIKTMLEERNKLYVLHKKKH